MTRLYENKGFWRRSNLSIGFVIVAVLWGAFEFWSALRGPAEGAATGYMWAAAFFFGGFYGLYQLMQEWRDFVTGLDLDEATGTMTVTVWQPQGPLRRTATRGELRNWRSHVRIGKRGARQFFLLADLAGYPRPLRFDLRPGSDVSGLSRIAPEAVAEYEATAGLAKPSP